MAKCDFARWAPDGSTPGGPITPRVVILHCTAVNFDAHPHSGLEWHFEVDFNGATDQLVDTNLRADANYKANNFAISIETWGVGDAAWTDAQIKAIVRLCRWANTTHGIPLVRCDRWDGSGIGHHTMWGAPSQWTPVAKSCPGPKRKQQFDTIVLPMLALPAGPPPPQPLPVEDADMEAAFVQAMHEMYYSAQPGSPAWNKAMVKSCNYWLDLLLTNKTTKAKMREQFATTVGA